MPISRIIKKFLSATPVQNENPAHVQGRKNISSKNIHLSTFHDVNVKVWTMKK